ncbi:MAG: DUF3368 domain-containing protein [Rhodothermales bacterium]
MPSSDAGALDAPTHSPVVSDTSPLVHLSRVGLFSLLETFYGRLLIPPAVWREAVEEGRGRVGEAEVRAAAGWIDIRTPTDTPFLRLLKQELDDGEAEGIALASEVGADLIVVDEAPARKSARAAGLRVTGTLGILIRAKSEGYLDALRPVLDRLRLESFRISDVLYIRVLKGVGEEP